MATDIIARGMAANAKKSVTELGNKIESEKWIGTKAEWEAVDKSTIKDGTIVYITDDETVILYDKAEMEKIATQVATDRKAAETAAKTAQAVADSLPDDYTTAVGKIAENTAEISAVKLTDKELQRRVDALYDIGQGITHRFETDTETAYQKAVPTGAKLMSVKNVGGRSIVFNQLVKTNTDFSNTITDTRTFFMLKIRTFDDNNTVKTDKILAWDSDATKLGKNSFILKITTDGKAVSISHNGEIRDIKIYHDTETQTIANHTYYISINLKSVDPTTVGGLQCNNLMLIDLTTMFGTGNEPTTAEEFEKIFPADYYPYCAGEIVNAGTESVVEQGKNLFDYTNEIYHGQNVSKVENGIIYTKGLTSTVLNIPTVIGKEYTLSFKTKSSAANQGGLRWSLQKGENTSYAHDSSLIKSEVGYAANTEYQALVKFVADTDFVSLCTIVGMIYDVQLEESSTPTAYTPYHQTAYPIPAPIKSLPGYGWSAGTAKNWVDYEDKKYVQCVQSVDLGTLTWTILSSQSLGDYFYAPATAIGAKRLGAYGKTVHNILCSKYIAASRNVNTFVDKTIILDGTSTAVTEIQIKDATYTDATTLKQAMQGVMLYYELATPIVTDISDLIPDDFLQNISVEVGGSITFKNSNDDYRLPVPNEEEYVVKLSEVGGSV